MKTEKKLSIVIVRLSDKEKSTLVKYAKKQGDTVSGLLRKLIEIVTKK